MSEEQRLVKQVIENTVNQILEKKPLYEFAFDSLELAHDAKHILKKDYRSFIELRSVHEFTKYVECYHRNYQIIFKKDPTEIWVKNCYIHGDFRITDNSTFLQNYNYIFDSCKVVPMNLTYQLMDKIIKFKNSDIDINSDRNFNNLKLISRSIIKNLPNVGSKLKIAESIVLPTIQLNKTKIINCHIFTLNPNYDIEISNSYIEQVNIKGKSNFKLAAFNTTFNETNFANTKFSKAILSKVIFKKNPNVADIDFPSSNVNFMHVKFDDVNSGEALGTFRNLTEVCQSRGYEHGAIFFHGLELETYYNVYLKDKHYFSSNGVERFNSEFYRKFTDYGRNLLLPILWLLLISTYFFAWYLHITDNLKLSVKLAVRNFLGPIALAIQKDIELKVSSWLIVPDTIHIVISTVIWFLIIFMIRRRFKI